MTEFQHHRPRLAVSQCLGGDLCRYDGGTATSDFVVRLTMACDVVSVCPEMAIGMGVPRDPIVVVSDDGVSRELYQPASGSVYTDQMVSFANEWTTNYPDLDGFILKSRSPSCGLRDVKIRSDREDGPVHDFRGTGMFAEAILDQYPDHAVEDERRLENPEFREHFLVKLYCLADLREAEHDGSPEAMRAFVVRHSWLFRAYNLYAFRKLDDLSVTYHQRRRAKRAWEGCRELVGRILARRSSRRCHVRVMNEAIDAMAMQISDARREKFARLERDYLNGQLPRGVLIGVLRDWSQQYHLHDVSEQSYFSPFPSEFLDSAAGA